MIISNSDPLNQFTQNNIKDIHSHLINNFNKKFTQISPDNYDFNNIEGVKGFWICNGNNLTEYGKIENDYILMNLVMRTKQVSNEALYMFMITVNIDPAKKGGWFKSSSWSFSDIGDKRAIIFKEFRNCDPETFYKNEKLKREQLAKELGIVNDVDMVALDRLKIERHVSNNDLKNIIATSKDQNVMLKTLVAIGKELERNKTDTYFKRTKENDVGNTKGQRLTNAFAITKDKIYITEKDSFVGKGTSKKVSDAFNLNLKDINFVRLKILPTGIVDTAKEAKILNELHENAPNGKASCLAPPYEGIIRYNDQNGMQAMVMYQEKLPGGDGNKLLNASAIQQLKGMIQFGEGLDYMHKNGYVHSDNKLPNLLIDENGDIKVSDFGMSTPIDGTYRGGNNKYAPQEIVYAFDTTLLQMNPSIDSFEYGGNILTLFNSALIHNQTWFGRLSDNQIQDEINNAKKMLVGTDEEKRIRSAMLEVAEKLMKNDPNARLSCAEAVAQLKMIA